MSISLLFPSTTRKTSEHGTAQAILRRASNGMGMGQRVFIVDNEPLIAGTLGTIFERVGFASAVYNDPLELLKACEKHTPAVVITDVMMPQMSGVDLALRLEERHPTCKVILISGMMMASDLWQEATKRANVLDFLEKPIHPDLVVQHMRKALS